MPESSEPSSSMLTVQQVAQDLQVNPKTVYGWIQRGMLPALNFAYGKRRNYRVERAVYEEFKRSKLVSPPPAAPESS